MRVVFTILFLLALTHHAEGATKLAVGRTERYRLPNGLEVILQQDRRQPRVAVVMIYDVGHRDEPHGYAGIAHLIEHLTYRGSRHAPPLAAMTLLEAAGANEINAGLGDDRTMYYALLPASSLELALWIEADRMAFVLEHLEKKSLLLERAVVLNELRERQTPTRLFHDHIARTLYPDSHPYAPPESEAEDTAATELRHVQWFFQKTYRPDNACLSMVGDFDIDATKALVKRYFATIGRPPGRVTRPAARPLSFSGKQRITIAAPYSRERFAMLWPVPGPETADAAALHLAASALGEGPVSRLYRRVVDAAGTASSIATDIEHLDLVSWFNISAELAHDRTHAEVEGLVDREIRRLQSAPLTADELRALKRNTTMQIALAHEHLLARALLLGVSARSRDRKLYDPNREIARVEAVTTAAVLRAAQRHLRLDRRLVAWMKSDSNAPIDGRITHSSGHLYP